MRHRLTFTLLLALLLGGSVQAQQTPSVDKIYGWMKVALAPPAPTNLTPANGTSVATPVSLTWEAVGADSVTVRFGTSSSPPSVASSVTTGSYAPSGLIAGTKYYWQIQAVNTKGTKLGPIWSFTTATAPVPPPPPPPPPGSLAVVPGIQGYGIYQRAAYGCASLPTVLKVTTLADSGSGSLRAAMEATVPRVVIFEVAGYVDLADMIRITSPCLTVAGQTAPSPGITLRKYGIEVQSSNVLLQQFRIRPGEWGQGKADNCALIAWGQNAHDIVLDHMSVSWGPDENLAADTYYSGDMNMTVWRSITAESLDFPTSVPLSAGHGLLVQANSKKVSVAQSLFAGNRERNPYAQSNTSLAAVNNLIFNAFANWHFFFANYDIAGNPSAGAPWYASVVGNRLIAGPNTDDDSTYPQGTAFYYDVPGSTVIQGNRIYRADNTREANLGFPFVDQENEMNYDPNVSSPPTQAPLTAFAPVPSTDVEALVLQHAGARPLDRDAIDARIVNDVATRRGRGYFSSQITVGGYPVVTPTTRVLSVPASPHTVSASGYTTLELWLQSYSTAVGE